MHDPLTQAFQIKYPWKKWGGKGKSDWERNYREAFITIWHKDPEKGGSDDSCGWFKRSHHGDKRSSLLENYHTIYWRMGWAFWLV